MFALLRSNGLILLGLLLPLAATAGAKEPALTKSGQVREFSQGSPFDSEPSEDVFDSELAPGLDPELEAILQAWQTAKLSIDRLDAEYFYEEFDALFDVGQRGQGQLAVDTYGRGFLSIGPVKTNPTQAAKPSVPEGEGHINVRWEPIEPGRYHWTGRHLIAVDDAAHNYEEFEISPKFRNNRFLPSRPLAPPLLEDATGLSRKRLKPTFTVGESTIQWNSNQPATRGDSFSNFVGQIIAFTMVNCIDWSPLEELIMQSMAEHPLIPFLLEMPIGELRSQYEITLVEESETEVRLKFDALKEDLPYPKVLLVLSRSNYQPKAIKLFDEERIIVYVFKNIRINSTPVGGFSDLGDPQLGGYQKKVAPAD